MYNNTILPIGYRDVKVWLHVSTKGASIEGLLVRVPPVTLDWGSPTTDHRQLIISLIPRFVLSGTYVTLTSLDQDVLVR